MDASVAAVSPPCPSRRRFTAVVPNGGENYNVLVHFASDTWFGGGSCLSFVHVCERFVFYGTSAISRLANFSIVSTVFMNERENGVEKLITVNTSDFQSTPKIESTYKYISFDRLWVENIAF